MQFDFWRAMGVAWGISVVSTLVYQFSYSLWNISVPLFLAKDVVATALVAAFFALVYFRDARIAPSLTTGAYLGLIITVVPVAVGVAGGTFDAAMGTQYWSLWYPQDLSSWYTAFSVSLALVNIIAMAVTGWYIGKRR